MVAGHSGERCKDCKKIVKALLEKLFGPVEENHQFQAGTLPDDYVRTGSHAALSEIFGVLQRHRGFRVFVRAAVLPKSDFYVPKARRLFEFDESQHFTEPRKLSLDNYPKGMAIGFCKADWMGLCSEIHARDNDPPYRDEQRAWYDTLRDFLPETQGLEPTVRIHSKAMRWCELDPKNPADVDRFKRHIETSIERGRTG
ncbi:MAG TPA: hypothetical protein VND64_24650 [Pirellulales bacterium]|nr:hypothetical protein [Pirellulales bacterium]